VLAGVFEALVLVLMLTAMQFTVAAVVISIKRAGVIFSVLLGWFMFKERGISDRLIASLVMAFGVLIFFLTKPDAAGHALLELPGAMVVALGALALMTVALYLTRNHHAGSTSQTPAQGSSK
jgi:drug/metabolite transporter (DMT)-like permease